jgi:hypothetical protein
MERYTRFLQRWLPLRASKCLQRITIISAPII